MKCWMNLKAISSAGHVEDIVGRSLGPNLGGVDRDAMSRNQVRVERILHIRGRIGLAPETGRVTLIPVKSNSGAPSQCSQ
jgi:hypothetical protein